MKNLSAHIACFIALHFLSSKVAAALMVSEKLSACNVVYWDSKKFSKPYIVINEPGAYCLDRDYKFICYPWMHSCLGKFISIRSNDVTLDMRGHTLESIGTNSFDGIWIGGDRVQVANGKILGVGLAIHASGPDGSSYSTRFFDKNAALDEIGGVGGISISNMELMTRKDLGVAVYLSSKNVEVKNNRIKGTVALRGEGHVFLNNKIEVAALPWLANGRDIFRYAILARDVDNLKMVDNIIKIDGDSTQFKGVAVWNSTKIELRKNSVSGAQVPFELVNSSEVAEQ